VKLFDQTLTLLGKALDVRLERQNVLAGNLANANTPGFVPKDLNFESALSGQAAAPTAVAAADPSGFIPLESAGISVAAAPAALSGAGSTVGGPSVSAGLDGNRVDLDRSMVALAENALQYSAAAKAANKKLAILRYVASDGNA
jgi:flagellar basal-body rod protein FlgB